MITCDECIHWEERSTGRDEHLRWGRCCFNPPVVFYIHKIDGTRTVWPETEPNDSCAKSEAMLSTWGRQDATAASVSKRAVYKGFGISDLKQDDP